MTHPARLTDTRTNYKPRAIFAVSDMSPQTDSTPKKRETVSVRSSTHSMRLVAPSLGVVLLPDSSVAPFTRSGVILDLLFDVIPADHVRHFFAHLVEPADEQERASLLSAARRHLAALDYVDESSIYTGIRLLERIPDAEESERLMRAILEVEGSATMARDAVNILRDSERFAHWFAKVPEYALAPEAIPFVFGKGGFEVVAPLLRRVLAANTSFQMIAIKDLIRIHSHRAVEGFLGLYDSSAVGPMAHAWLTSEGANAIKGLIPIATNHSPLTHVAQRVLREYRDRGHEEIIEHLAAQTSEDIHDRIHEEIMEQGVGVRHDLPVEEWPTWMTERLARKKPSKRMPDYIDVTSLPPLVTSDGKHTLPQKVVNGVINRIVGSRPDSVDDLIPKLRDFLDPRSRHDFVWYIFERWREQGAEAKQKFCMWALGFLGTDETGARLLPYLDEWAEESAFYRATWALDVYRCLGTDASLTMLSGVAHRAKSRPLRNKANEALDTLASDRGLSRAELDDRVVPTCGLDADATRTFDFGGRTFEAFLDASKKPRLRDEAEKELSKLPTMRSSDDPEKVARAREEWSLFTEQVRETIKVQSIRLEEAMVVQRRWRVATFSEYIVAHPILGRIAQDVLWGGFSQQAELQSTFLITEDGAFLTRDGDEADLDDVWRVGVVHPLYLDESEREEWHDFFEERDLTTPFAQIDRPVFESSAEDQQAGTLVSFDGESAEAIALRKRLEERLWRRDQEFPQMIYAFDKRFPSHGVTAEVKLSPGMATSWQATHEPQTIASIRFFEDVEMTLPLDLSRVPDIVVSEVALDVASCVK